MRRRSQQFGVTTLALVLALTGTASSMQGSDDHAPTAPTRLTVDDDSAPLAVTDDPAFGWLPNDADANEIQSAYRIVVTEPNGAVVADTQKVTSSQESYVHVPGLHLQPNHAYVWRVRTWDRTGREGEQSQPANFTTGLGDRDWTAHWIRRPGAEHEPIEDYSRFRKEIAINASPVVRARVRGRRGAAVRVVRQRHAPRGTVLRCRIPTSSTTRPPTSPPT